MGLFDSRGTRNARNAKGFLGTKEPDRKPVTLNEAVARGAQRKKSPRKDSRSQDIFGNKTNQELVQQFSLSWVGKLRDYKDRRALEEEFREKFLNGEFQVTKGVALRKDGSVIKINYEGDIEYGY